ncbi:acyltransferase family protein [Streptomyces coffeae]|uniref:Acetyltransferase n=1 Tax=Streptomyces coffeae TaxID=621382 RepID=A0ABS1NRT0_9ACTN|nr:acyltransferase family protein [Streptomyces coffeae]MBL1102782.1 acetyltransferase [Streptomyces coffeae]
MASALGASARHRVSRRFPDAPRATRPYAPGLDGLRALAVTAVVLYHVNPGWLPGGFLGVDVFFVLSGFLISDLLLAEWQRHGRIDLRDFWLRRVRRLLPALVLVLLVATAAAAVFRPRRLASATDSLFSVATFTNNWWQISTDASYFASFGPPPLFQHLWTLSMEEQFYLLWPLTLLALMRCVPWRGVEVTAVLAGAAASMIAMARLYEPDLDPSRVYFGTDTHVFPLLIGAALALLRPTTRLIRKPSRWPLRTVGLLGVAGLGVLVVMACVVSEGEAALYPGGFAAVALATAAVVLAAVQPMGRLAFVLGVRPLRWIGVRSYGIYLWHLPLIALATPDRMTPADAPLFAIAAAFASVGLAALSYRWVEQPIRRLGLGGSALRRHSSSPSATPRRRSSFLAGAVVGCVATLALAAVAVSTTPKGFHPPFLPTRTGQASPDATAQPTAPSERSKPSPSPTRRNVPTGKVTAIGDSVMVAATPALKKKFPGITIDAKLGRQLSAAPQEVKALERQDALGDTLIIGLGTNGTGGKTALEAVVNAAGPGKRIVLVTCYVPRSWQDTVNQDIREVAANHRNVVVADWNRAIADRGSLLADDGVHPSPAGARLYADTIAAALATLPAER